MLKLISPTLLDVVIEWGGGDNATNTSSSSLTTTINEFLERFKGVIVGSLGIANLTMVVIFIWLLFSLATNSTNFAGKSTNIKRLAIWAVCMAMLGSLDLVIAVIYGVFR